MKIAAAYKIPITINSDAHQPEDCGKFCDEAIIYAKNFGYKNTIRFSKRKREEVELG